MIRSISKFLLAATLAACVSYTPITHELVAARQTYAQATQSAAPAEAPGALASARNMLDEAEHIHAYAPGSQREREVAYLALRQAQTAITQGNSRAARRAADQRAAQALREAETAKAQAQYAEQQRQAAEQQRLAAEQNAARAQMTAAQTEAALAEVRRQLAAQGEANNAQTAQLRQQEAQLQAQLDTMRSERDKMQGERDQAVAEMQRLGELAQKADKSLVLTMPGEVMFRVNEATLLPRAKEKLNDLAQTLLSLDTAQTFLIEGHADSTGSESYNRQLSQQRADAVRTYLIERGVNPDRIRAVGRGDTQPVASNENPEGRANNRRVEITVSPAATARR